MADNISSLKISVDSSEVKKATNDLSNLTGVSGKTEKSTTSLIGGFTKLQAGALAAAAAVGALTKAGIDYNAQIEKLTNGLTTLNVLTSKNVDSNGKAITLEQKYNLARRESIETMQKLNAINLETPHTLDQTVQIYKAMYTSMKTVGVSSEEMIDLTKKLSIAAGSSGIEFQQLLSGIDGLATGTVEVSSELGRFLKSIGLTNEELKKSSNIYETINNKVKDVKGIIGYEEAVSNLSNSFEQLTGALVEPFFDNVKDGITGLAGMFNDLTKSVTLFYDKFKSISELSTKDQLNKRAIEVSERIKTIQEDLKDPSFFQSTGKLSAELRAANLELLAINQQFETMDKQSQTKLVANGIDRNQAEITKIAGSELEKYNLSLEQNIQQLKKAGATEEEISIFRKKSLQEFNEKQSKSNKDVQKSNDDLNNAINEMSKVGLSDYSLAVQDITQKVQEWIKAGADYNEVIAKQKQLIEELNLQNSLSIASEQLSFLEKKAQLMTDEYEKSKLLLEISYAKNLVDIQGRNIPIEDKQRLIEQETELYNLTKDRIELDRNTEFNDTLKNFQDDALERQIALNESMYEFGDSFDGIAKQVSAASKAVINMNTIAIKAKKEESKLNDKYSEEFLKYANDEVKTKELMSQYEKDQNQLKEESFNAQIAGWANLAGAMSSVFEAGSTGAKAFTAIQATLGIVSSLTAIAMAWASAPFPANIPAVVAATASLVPIIGQLSSLGGSGGSKGGASISQTEINQNNIEATYTPMTDRLDRQIQLLESIDKNGSASKISTELAAVTFQKDYALFVNKSLELLHDNLSSAWGTQQGKTSGRVASENALNAMLGFDIGTNIGESYKIDKNALRESYNFMKLIQAANTSVVQSTDWNVLFDKGWGKYGSPLNALQARIAEFTNEFQGMLSDYTMSLLDSMDELKSAKNEFMDLYDDITGTSKYSNQTLKNAFIELEGYLKGQSLTDYLESEIENIKKLESFLTEDKINTLLMQDPTKLEEQLKIIEDLRAETGMTFENGAEDALNYLESIKLVSDAMKESRENTQSFYNVFRSENDLLAVQSNNLGLTLPKTFKELGNQFKILSSDILGLTNEELDYLTSSKDYIENKNEELIQLEIDKKETEKQLQEDLLSSIKSNISLLDNILGSLKNKIDELRKSADTTNTYGINKFYESMNKTLELMKGKDYKAIEESLKSTIGYSSALNESKNFALSRDMQYAQLVAANQFESMDLTLNDELDYLKLIEQNTANTVDTLAATLTALGSSIGTSLDKNSTAFAEMIKGVTGSSSSGQLVRDIYSKYGIDKYQTDTSGYAYWEQELSTGKISVVDLEKTIQKAAREKGMLSFAVGTTNVSNDMTARIHQGEIITPKNFSDGLRNGDLVMGQTSNMVNAINNMGILVSQNVANLENKLNSIISLSGTQVNKLDDIYNASNGSLVTLENIKKVI